MGQKGGKLVIWGPVLPIEKFPSLSDVRSSTRKLDACTETHINRLYAETEKIIATKKKSHRESPVFARKGQNGVAQARAPGAEARSLSCSSSGSPKEVP